MRHSRLFQTLFNLTIASIMLLQSWGPVLASQPAAQPDELAGVSSMVSERPATSALALAAAQRRVAAQKAYHEPAPVLGREILPPGTIQAASLPITYTVFLPITSKVAPIEFALQPAVWMEATQSWPAYQIASYGIRYPQEASVSTVLPPLMTPGLNVVSEDVTLQFSVEPRSTADMQIASNTPARLADYLRQGFSISSVTVKGVPAWLIASETPIAGLCQEIIVEMPEDWLHFRLFAAGSPAECGKNEEFLLLVSSLQVQVGTHQPELNPADEAASEAIEWINYNRSSAYNYAAAWWSVNNNDDGYFVWCSGGVACDGAHYLAHFMQAGGFPIHWNVGQNHSDSRVTNTASQRNYVVGMADVSTTSAGNLKVGDLIYINNYSTYCWGMGVVRMSGSTPYVSMHSINRFDVRYDLYYCGSSHWYEFVHIDATADHPADPKLNSSLNLDPATQITGQNVRASFTIKNFGGQSVSLSLRVTTNGGGDFATVSQTLSPGASYTYSQSRAFASEGLWNSTCAQMKIGSNSWVNVPSNGYTVCRRLSIVAPATTDVQLNNHLSITPIELSPEGGNVTVAFQVKNLSAYTQVEKFRALEQSNTISFAETTEQSLAPGSTYSYSSTKAFHTPGIYEITAEHYVNGTWTALYGGSNNYQGSGFVRVLSPPPPAGDEHKGTGDENDGNAGEPVNTVTGNYYYQVLDLSDPTPGLALSVDRWYNALDAGQVNGPFGYGTSWTYDMVVTWRPDKSAIVRMPDGHVAYYLGTVNPNNPSDMAGIYQAQGEHEGSLERFGDGSATLTMPDQSAYHFNASGRISGINHPHPAAITVSYSGDQITQIAHSAGVTYTLTYSGTTISAISSSSGRSVSYSYDAGGDLIAVTRPDGSVYTYAYDANHRVIAGFDPNANAYVRNVYDEQGRVIKQYDQAGLESVFSYDNQAVLHGINGSQSVTQQSFTDALGQIITHTYDTNLNLIAETDARGYTSEYSFDAQGNLTSKLDRNGNLWLYSYDVNGNLLSEEDPLGNGWTYNYDADNNRISQQDPLGNLWQYNYDAAGHLTQSIDPLGNVQEYGYDAQGHLLWESDASGAVTEYGYNEFGFRTVITDALGQASYLAYDSWGNQIEYTDANGNSARFSYDDLGRLTHSIDPLGTVITYTYDAMGNLQSVSDGLGNLKHYSYDEYDRVILETDFNGNATRYAYDALGHLTVITDTLGHSTVYSYDPTGNLISERDPLGNETHFEYDPEGHLSREIDPLGRVTEYSYDAAGRLVETRRPCDACEGGLAISQTVYDPAGRVVQEIDPRGAITRYGYDVLSRTAALTDTYGSASYYSYDPTGRLLQEVNPLGAVTSYEYDALGRVITTTNALGYQVSNRYDPAGNLIATTNERGYTTEMSYDANDRLVTMHAAAGHTTHYSYDGAGHLVSITDPLGHTSHYAYDTNGNQIAITDGRGYTTHTVYDELNRPVQVTDALGNTSLTSYDAAGRVLAQTDALGHTHTFSYDAAGRRLSEQSPLGYLTSYIYDNADNLIRRQDTNGGLWLFSYDAVGNQLRQTDPLGNIYASEYDLLGRVVRETDALGAAIQHSYDAAGRRILTIDARRARTGYAYDLLGQLVQETNPHGLTRQFSYDGAGNRLTEQDERGFTTTYVYDALNRQIAQSDALGNTRYNLYNALGQIQAEVDYNGFASQYAYDANGNLISSTDPLGNTSLTTYDALNRTSAVTDALGRTQTTNYDALGRISTETSPGGDSTTYQYDAEGRQTARTDPLGNTWLTRYDSMGRVTAEIDPLGRQISHTYNLIGQRIATSDALGRTTSYRYDTIGRLLSVTGPDGTSQHYSYDSAGHVLSDQDGNGNLTRYEYDLLGNLTRKTDPLGNQWYYQYDPASNLITTRTPEGHLITFAYDALGRQVAKAYDGLQVLALAYDANGNRTTMTDTLGTSTYLYDARNQLIQSSDPYGRLVQYAYDAARQQTQLIYPDGATAQYGYDLDGDLFQVIAPDGGVTTYTRDALGRTTLVTQGNGASVATRYDAVGNTLQIVQKDSAGVIFSQHDYTVDAAGRRTRLVESLPQGAFTTDYGYDDLDRLTASLASDGRADYYSFDAAGNRTAQWGTRLVDGVPEDFHWTYRYNAANQLLQWNNSLISQTSYSYDRDGKRVSMQSPQERMSLSYNAESRLIEAQVEVEVGGVWLPKDGIYETYAYDGNGRRVEKSTLLAADGSLMENQVYRYDDLETWNVLQTYADTASRYLYDESLHKLAFWQGNGSGYLQNDNLGSIIGATNLAGELSAPEGLARYDAYGALLGAETALVTTDGFSGYEHESYTGLEYARNRYYDTTTGTYLTIDPYPGDRQDILDLHRYLYVQANPLNLVDPLGLFDWTAQTVEQGDTLWDIATAWGVSVDEILAVNPQIGERHMIHPGQHLNLPECKSAQCQTRLQNENAAQAGVSSTNCGHKCGAMHTVKSGDTLAGIAGRYSIPWQWIYDANQALIGSNPNLIYAGQNLWIPCNPSNWGGDGNDSKKVPYLGSSPLAGLRENLTGLSSDRAAVQNSINGIVGELYKVYREQDYYHCSGLGRWMFFNRCKTLATMELHLQAMLTSQNNERSLINAKIEHVNRKIEIIPRGAPVGGQGVSCYTHSGHTVGERDCRGGNNKVIATHSGTVIFSGRGASCGRGRQYDWGWCPCNDGAPQQVVIKSEVIDGEWYETWYLHMKTGSLIPKGSITTQGTVIGDLGCTGLCTGPHVHYAIKRNGVYQNADSYIRTK